MIPEFLDYFLPFGDQISSSVISGRAANQSWHPSMGGGAHPRHAEHSSEEKYYFPAKGTREKAPFRKNKQMNNNNNNKKCREDYWNKQTNKKTSMLS